MAKNKNTNLENMVIEGEITATSNKINEKFRSEVNSKTAYIKVDKANSKLLKDFGLTEYTSKEDNTNFFIIKLTKDVRVYAKDGSMEIFSGEAHETNPNFKTNVIKMNIIKGNNLNQDFYRVQALLINDRADIQQLAPENPFKEFMDEDINIEGFAPTSSDDIPF